MKKKSSKTILAAVVIIILLTAVLICFFSFRKGAQKQYATDPVSVSDISSTVTIKGIIRGVKEGEIYSDSQYRIKNIPVKKGDMVRKDQVLAVLDIEKLQQQYDIARIDYDSAKKYYDDTKALFETGSVPQNTLDQAEKALEKAELACRIYDIENAGEIRSSMDGVVTEIKCSEGGYAAFSAIGQPAFVIEDRSKLLLKADLKEKYLDSVYPGQDAEITAEAMDDMTAAGKVTEIAPSGKVNPSTDTVVIPITIEIEDPSDRWMTGITGKAKLSMTADAALTVSIDAVSERDDETAVYVLSDDGTVRKVLIDTGINDGDRIQVTGGQLAEGDKLVLDPDTYIFE